MKTVVVRLLPHVMPLLLLLGACTSPDAPQTITGKVALSTFPARPTGIQAVRAGKVVAQTSLATDGSFRMDLPAHAAYHLELVTPGSRPVLVFPRRKTGKVETGFWVGVGKRPYGMGTVRLVGDPTVQTFRFNQAVAPEPVDPMEPGDPPKPPGAPECEDGIDPTTKAVCVNDEGDGDKNQDGLDQAVTATATAEAVCGVDEPNGDNSAEAAAQAVEENVTTDNAVVADFNVPPVLGCP
jgi:hypothetical protein